MFSDIRPSSLGCRVSGVVKGCSANYRVLLTGFLFLIQALPTPHSIDAPSNKQRSMTKRGNDRVLVFTSIIEPPFLSREFDNDSNSEILVGFIPDLVMKIAQKMRVPYRLKLVTDGGYGVRKTDGTWNGMLGEVIHGEVDVAVGALTVHPWRAQFVDFTVPFMQVGIATILKRPPPGQGLPISSPRELGHQTVLQYGLIPGTLTQKFFQTTNDTVLKRMWERMSNTYPKVFEWTSLKGVARVRQSNGKYVFFIESAFADFLVNQRPCDVIKLDELLNPEDYAFAVQKGSHLLNRLNRALRNLIDKGTIEKLKRKWWKSECPELLPVPTAKTETIQDTSPRLDGNFSPIKNPHDVADNQDDYGNHGDQRDASGGGDSYYEYYYDYEDDADTIHGDDNENYYYYYYEYDDNEDEDSNHYEYVDRNEQEYPVVIQTQPPRTTTTRKPFIWTPAPPRRLGQSSITVGSYRLLITSYIVAFYCQLHLAR